VLLWVRAQNLGVVNAAVVRANPRIVALCICAALDAIVCLSLPSGHVASGVLAAIDGQAAFLVGASLPLESVGVDFLQPLRSLSVTIEVGVADILRAKYWCAALLQGASLHVGQISWHPLCCRVTDFWEAHL